MPVEYALFAFWAWAELSGVRPHLYGGLALFYFVVYSVTIFVLTVRQNLRAARERRQSVTNPPVPRPAPSSRPSRHVWIKIKMAAWRFWWRAFRKKRLAPLDDALANAVIKGNVNNVAVFLSRGANANVFLVSMPLLAFAAGKGQLETARLLLAAGANVNARSALIGSGALARAVVGDHLEIVRLLLAHGANIDAKDNKGVTALMLVADSGNAALVRVLLEHGSNRNERARRGWTALRFAQRNQHCEIVELLQRVEEPGRPGNEMPG